MLRLLMAAIVGGVTGTDREQAHKWLGVRTLLLVCLECSPFTIVHRPGLFGSVESKWTVT